MQLVQLAQAQQAPVQRFIDRFARYYTPAVAGAAALVAIFLRKAYGLGAMARVGGSFREPVYTAAWPTGEFGGMGLEGAVRLGYRKELEAVEDPAERAAMFDKLVARMYEIGKATEAASHLEIDAVIDPVDTRSVVIRALNAALH